MRMNEKTTYENFKLSLQRFLLIIRQSLEFAHRPISIEHRQERLIPILFLVALITICYFPFINRAFHIDDPLFIWAAKHIQSNPSDPYAFNVNWYGVEMPMWFVTKNPPLASYYIALVASFFGWSEAVLHCAFLFPALAVAIGMYLLAQKYCKRPLIATLAGVLTPVYFVSSLTIMSDLMMLAFWLFAVYFWTKGIENGNNVSLIFAVLMISLAALTKYFGMTLVPLLILYTIFKKRSVGWWLLYFLIPQESLHGTNGQHNSSTDGICCSMPLPSQST